MSNPAVTLLVLLCTLLFSCAGEKVDKDPLPNEPEEVVRQYQAWYDGNEFEKAKKLSTTGEDQRLDEMEALLQGIAPDSTMLSTEFVDIQCRSNEQIAFCYCLLEDQEDRYQTLFILRRENGQWLVESPEADWPPANVEKEFEELMQDIIPGDSAIDLSQ